MVKQEDVLSQKVKQATYIHISMYIFDLSAEDISNNQRKQ